MMNSIKLFPLAVFLLLFISGCLSYFSPHGGAWVHTKYQPKKILISYEAEGVFPAGVRYFLVQTESGEAIFEQEETGDQRGSGCLFQTHWRDNQGDIFCAWYDGGTA